MRLPTHPDSHTNVVFPDFFTPVPHIEEVQVRGLEVPVVTFCSGLVFGHRPTSKRASTVNRRDVATPEAKFTLGSLHTRFAGSHV